MQGPNVKKLIAHKMSLDAVPPNCGDGLSAALGFLMDKDRIIRTAREAQEWVALAIQAVRQASGDNPWRNADDEAIAAEILRGIDEKKKAQITKRGTI